MIDPHEELELTLRDLHCVACRRALEIEDIWRMGFMDPGGPKHPHIFIDIFCPSCRMAAHLTSTSGRERFEAMIVWWHRFILKRWQQRVVNKSANATDSSGITAATPSRCNDCPSSMIGEEEAASFVNAMQNETFRANSAALDEFIKRMGIPF